MGIEKIKNLLELLEEFQNLEFWNDTNLLENEEIEEDSELDLYSLIELLYDYINKNYYAKNIDSWKIKK